MLSCHHFSLVCSVKCFKSELMPVLIIPASDILQMMLPLMLTNQGHVKIEGCWLCLSALQLLHGTFTHEEWSRTCKNPTVVMWFIHISRQPTLEIHAPPHTRRTHCITCTNANVPVQNMHAAQGWHTWHRVWQATGCNPGMFSCYLVNCCSLKTM